MEGELHPLTLSTPPICEVVDPPPLRTRSLSLSSPLTSRSRSRSLSRDLSDRLAVSLSPSLGGSLSKSRTSFNLLAQADPAPRRADCATQTDPEQPLPLPFSCALSHRVRATERERERESVGEEEEESSESAERERETESERDEAILEQLANGFIQRFVQRTSLSARCGGALPVYETYYDGSKASLAHSLSLAVRTRHRVRRYGLTNSLPFWLHNVTSALSESDVARVAQVDIAHYGTVVVRALNRSTCVDIEDSALCVDLADAEEELKQQSFASNARSVALFTRAVETFCVSLSAERVRHWAVVSVAGVALTLVVRSVVWRWNKG